MLLDGKIRFGERLRRPPQYALQDAAGGIDGEIWLLSVASGVDECCVRSRVCFRCRFCVHPFSTKRDWPAETITDTVSACTGM